MRTGSAAAGGLCEALKLPSGMFHTRGGPSRSTPSLRLPLQLLLVGGGGGGGGAGGGGDGSIASHRITALEWPTDWPCLPCIHPSRLEAWWRARVSHKQVFSFANEGMPPGPLQQGSVRRYRVEGPSTVLLEDATGRRQLTTLIMGDGRSDAVRGLGWKGVLSI
ncbi:hypothetical protein G7046_g3356 [Stylonectria norvegica]|nr:hypothetical protein G7046_g3356 [Stylonectria norvegica]